nr:hypothetical protein [Myxococcus xanthus]
MSLDVSGDVGEVGAGEVGAGEVGAGEVGAGESGVTEIGVEERGSAEISAAEVESREVDSVESDSGEVRPYVWVVLSPLVPHAAGGGAPVTNLLNVRAVCHGRFFLEVNIAFI